MVNYLITGRACLIQSLQSLGHGIYVSGEVEESCNGGNPAEE